MIVLPVDLLEQLDRQITFEPSILINELKEIGKNIDFSISLNDLENEITFDYIEFSNSNKYNRKNLALALICFATTTSYSDQIIIALFDYIKDNATQVLLGAYLSTIVKGLFPEKTKQAQELIDNLTNKAD